MRYFLLLCWVSGAFAAVNPQLLQDETKIVPTLLESYHYAQPELVALDTKEIISAYVNTLDGTHGFFLAQDIQEIQVEGKDLVQLLERGDTAFSRKVLTRLQLRASERIAWVLERLTQPIAETRTDTFAIDRRNSPFFEDIAAGNDFWEKRLTFDFITERLSKHSATDAIEALKRRYSRLGLNFKNMSAADAQEILLTSLAEMLDPHSAYFSPQSSDEFNAAIKLQLIGIGVVLQMGDYGPVFAEILPGGSAALSQQLHVNDLLVGVEDADGNIVDTRDIPLRDTTALIRGAANTCVIIYIQTPQLSERKRIELVRKPLQIAQGRAKGNVYTQDGARIGVIRIPSFYGDPARDVPATTSDTVDILQRMQKDGPLDALVLDLRNNGGGLLIEAIRLSGVFLSEGPVVQVRDKFDRVQVDDRVGQKQYDGLLTIIVNRSSASASEIFAGSLQAYGRALIVGDPQTHGKGTVQMIYDMRDYVSNPGPTGSLKLTIQKFYLSNGASTQNRGVLSDIVIPSPEPLFRRGESDLPHALIWDEIKPARGFSATRQRIVFPETMLKLKQASDTRIRTSPEFLYTAQIIHALAERKDRDVSLNLEQREQEQIADTVFAQKESKLKESFTLTPTQIYDFAGKTDTGSSLDLTLLEALRITADWCHLQKKI